MMTLQQTEIELFVRSNLKRTLYAINEKRCYKITHRKTSDSMKYLLYTQDKTLHINALYVRELHKDCCLIFHFMVLGY